MPSGEERELKRGRRAARSRGYVSVEGVPLAPQKAAPRGGRARGGNLGSLRERKCPPAKSASSSGQPERRVAAATPRASESLTHHKTLRREEGGPAGGTWVPSANKKCPKRPSCL